jgi:hypothetical protein
VACLNLSCDRTDASLTDTKASSAVVNPEIKFCTANLASGIFCTSANAASVTGTPAFAIKS